MCYFLLFSAYCPAVASVEGHVHRTLGRDKVHAAIEKELGAENQLGSSARTLQQAAGATQAPAQGPRTSREVDEAFVSASGLYFQVSVQRAGLELILRLATCLNTTAKNKF